MNAEIKKQGIWNASTFIEGIMSQYDSSIYEEPDGSKWVKLSHHNNPGTARFASTNTFDAGVYLDANRWFCVSDCALSGLNQWEFMIKQKNASTDTAEKKYRWVQYNNPMLAVSDYATVTSDQVVKNTSSGYSTVAAGGALYKLNSSSYLVVANGTNGNWFGAIGAWGSYNSGIPGYPGTGAVTTGYLDLYFRIDNLPIVNKQNLWIKKPDIVIANEIYEI